MIYNDELRQIPRFLQAKELHKRTFRDSTTNYVKLKVVSPYFYKSDYINLTLLKTTPMDDIHEYINSIKEEHIDKEKENILLFYLENPTLEEYRRMRKELYVNNYLIGNMSVKITFLVKNNNGFTLLNNYYFVDFSSDLIKDKYKINSNLPFPCDILSQRVYNEIYFKLCGK